MCYFSFFHCTKVNWKCDERARNWVKSYKMMFLLWRRGSVRAGSLPECVLHWNPILVSTLQLKHDLLCHKLLWTHYFSYWNTSCELLNAIIWVSFVRFKKHYDFFWKPTKNCSYNYYDAFSSKSLKRLNFGKIRFQHILTRRKF